MRLLEPCQLLGERRPSERHQAVSEGSSALQGAGARGTAVGSEGGLAS